MFLTKNADGDISVVEFDGHDHLSGFAEIEGEVGGLIGPEDYEFVAEELFEDSSAAVILIEDLWAAPLADAVEAEGVRCVVAPTVMSSPGRAAALAEVVLGAAG